MIEFKYRPDIDGLRAIAVLLVILFHAGIGCPGGFVGVDVFFVISGFLITGLIIKEQNRGDFQLSRFWTRRIRRIVPAATCVVSATLVVGFLIQLPTDFMETARAAIAQQLMGANFFYCSETDYFSGPAELKPLLHTWSLSVEEQFYLFYPFLLMWAACWKRFRIRVLACLGIASFLLSAWITNSHPATAFYLLPTRAWELLLGAIVVFAPTLRGPTWTREVCGWAGAGMILSAGFLFDGMTPFPGIGAALPCTGAALLIYSNSQHLNSVGRILATRPLVFVGLISYSLYLWHWPVLAFSRYCIGGDVLPVTVAMTAMAGSFALAVLSWRFVETPFRRKSQNTPQFSHSLKLAAIPTFAVLLICSFIVFGRGLPLRYSNQVLKHDVETLGRYHKDFHRDTVDVLNGNLPVVGPETGEHDQIDCLIWGDSHAMVAATACDQITEESDVRCAIASRHGTAPLLSVWQPATGHSAIAWNEAVLDFVRKKKIRNVILVSRWAVYVEGRTSGKMDTLIVDHHSRHVSRQQSREALHRGLKATIDALTAVGAKVWIMEQVPYQYGDPNKKMPFTALMRQTPPAGVSEEMHRMRQANVKAVFSRIDPASATTLDPAQFCFDENGVSRLGDASGSYYRDEDHLTKFGATTLLGDLLGAVFSTIANDTRREAESAGNHTPFFSQR